MHDVLGLAWAWYLAFVVIGLGVIPAAYVGILIFVLVRRARKNRKAARK